jgi:hypothetical protein
MNAGSFPHGWTKGEPFPIRLSYRCLDEPPVVFQAGFDEKKLGGESHGQLCWVGPETI